jgi:hypothetical protein
LPGITSNVIFKLLDAISGLSELEALGCDVRSIADIEDIGLVAEHLPLTLAALHLQFCWENVPFTESGMHALLDRLAAMRGLELVHIQTFYAANAEAAEELAFALPSIEIIGLGPHMWKVDRDEDGLSMHRWTAKQIVMRTAHTIGAPGEW